MRSTCMSRATNSRFDLLRDRTVEVLSEILPDHPGNSAIAAGIVRVVRVDYRGKYIASIKKLDQLQRDLDIFAKANTPEQMERMAVEYKISVVRAYQINADIMMRKNKREQPLLPGM